MNGIKKSARGIFERQLTEEDVVGQIRALLEFNGARVHRIVERIPWGRRTSTPGMPDLVGWWPKGSSHRVVTGGEAVFWAGPQHFFVECKRPGGKHRPAQVAWIDRARQDGVIAFFADSIEAMVKGFAEYGIVIRGG